LRLMRSARLHGIGDLQIDEVPVPDPDRGELLVRVLMNGICATDARKYQVGLNDGSYPFNPGHEWVGEIVEVGRGVDGWRTGTLVVGDTYGGYADYATLPVEPGPWSAGPVELPDGMPLEGAVFVEPLADCLHAVHDQARIGPGDLVAVIGAGAMGLQAIAAAVRAGANVAAVERIPDRIGLARRFGAAHTAGGDGFVADVRSWAGGEGVDAVLLMVGAASLVEPAVRMCRPGGITVLFAGFGTRGRTILDLNDIHYREKSLVGSEWIGAPPNQKRHRYSEALEWLAGGSLPVEELVTRRVGYSGLRDCFEHWDRLDHVKTVFYPGLDDR
jgi:threonine dehydrogenase-like Zn-dependent dehydrogenase